MRGRQVWTRTHPGKWQITWFESVVSVFLSTFWRPPEEFIPLRALFLESQWMNEMILQKTTAWLMQDLQSRCIMYARQYFPAFLPLCPLISFPWESRDSDTRRRSDGWGVMLVREDSSSTEQKKRHWLSNLPPAALRPPHQNVRACQVRRSTWILIEWGELGTTHPDVCLEKS